MESNSSNDSSQEICWFCKKGRHSECMKRIPVNTKTDGPHDCSFNTEIVLVPVHISIQRTGLVGFEPTTAGLKGQCATWLRYRPRARYLHCVI